MVSDAPPSPRPALDRGKGFGIRESDLAAGDLRGVNIVAVSGPGARVEFPLPDGRKMVAIVPPGLGAGDHFMVCALWTDRGCKAAFILALCRLRFQPHSRAPLSLPHHPLQLQNLLERGMTAARLLLVL